MIDTQLIANPQAEPKFTNHIEALVLLYAHLDITESFMNASADKMRQCFSSAYLCIEPEVF